MEQKERREILTSIAWDTLARIKEEPTLRKAVNESRGSQVFFNGRKEYYRCQFKRRKRPARVFLSGKRTMEAALAYKGQKVAVLNFANEYHVGGGFLTGAGAQEESLCRCSTLYPSLNTKAAEKEFYRRHKMRNKSPLGSGDVLVNRDVIIFKTDEEFPKELPKEEWKTVSVFTCAAPDLSKGTVHQKAVEKALKKRIEMIFRLGISCGAEVLILGAFGCGVFQNPPELVARLMVEMAEKYRWYYKAIEFAVYCPEGHTENMDAFRKEFQKKRRNKQDVP